MTNVRLVQLLQLGVDVNYMNSEQGSVLLAALKAENLALVCILLERGLYPASRLKCGVCVGAIKVPAHS